MQQDFVRTIIEYVRQTGDITADDILDRPPFADTNMQELFLDKFAVVRNLVESLHDLVAA